MDNFIVVENKIMNKEFWSLSKMPYIIEEAKNTSFGKTYFEASDFCNQKNLKMAIKEKKRLLNSVSMMMVIVLLMTCVAPVMLLVAPKKTIEIFKISGDMLRTDLKDMKNMRKLIKFYS